MTWILGVKDESKTKFEICVRSSGGSESKVGDIVSGYCLDVVNAWIGATRGLKLSIVIELEVRSRTVRSEDPPLAPSAPTKFLSDRSYLDRVLAQSSSKTHFAFFSFPFLDQSPSLSIEINVYSLS